MECPRERISGGKTFGLRRPGCHDQIAARQASDFFFLDPAFAAAARLFVERERALSQNFESDRAWPCLWH